MLGVLKMWVPDRRWLPVGKVRSGSAELPSLVERPPFPCVKIAALSEADRSNLSFVLRHQIVRYCIVCAFAI